MGIRTEALNSNAFQKLYEAYCSRTACVKRWKETGQQIAAVVGSDVPEELLLAAGIQTLRVFQEELPGETPVASKYLEGRVLSNRPVLGMFENLVNGTWEEMADHVVISNSDGSSYGLFNVLRELRRASPECRIAPLYFLDLLFTRYYVHMKRNTRVVRKFREEVERWTGHAVTDEALQAACELYNENRRALREFDRLRFAPVSRVTGSEALVVIGASFFMEKREHTALVRELTKDAQNWPEAGGKRVFFTGADQQNTQVYDIIESAGGHIVGEDHNWGTRHYRQETVLAGPLEKALADRYVLRTGHADQAFVAQRVEDVCQSAAECGADVVVYYLTVSDNAPCWDYPAVKEALGGRGIPSILLYGQANPVQDPDGLKKTIESILN